MEDLDTFAPPQLADDTIALLLEQRRRAVLCAAGYVVAGVLSRREQRAARRWERRLYLTRPDLLPNPRVNTPWQRLYEGRNDRAFITTMGVDVATFNIILEGGFSIGWDSLTIPRNDVHAHGAPRLERRSLDAAGALGLALHYLNSTMRTTSLQQIFALIPTTVSRYISFALQILLNTLRRLRDAQVVWPDQDKMEEYSRMICDRHSRLWGAFGFIDGLNLPVQEVADPMMENATYNGWLHEHFVSSVLVFAPDGTVIACNLNAPGSWHDSQVARPIYEKLRTATPDGFYLVADTAFPRGAGEVADHICAPMKSGQRFNVSEGEMREKVAFDHQLLSCRQAAEWGMRTIQGSFGRLRMPLDGNDAQGRHELLEICIRLTNLRARRVGVSQIKNTFIPLWKAGEQEKMWEGFEGLLFGEIRKHDRVSKFHIVVSEEA